MRPSYKQNLTNAAAMCSYSCTAAAQRFTFLTNERRYTSCLPCRERALRQLFSLFACSFVGALQLVHCQSWRPSLTGDTCKSDTHHESISLPRCASISACTYRFCSDAQALCNAVFFVAYAVLAPSTPGPALAAGAHVALKNGSWPSKGSEDSAGSLPVGRRGSADTQAARSLLSEDSSRGQPSSQALTRAQVPVLLWHIAVPPSYEDAHSCIPTGGVRLPCRLHDCP